MTRARSNLPLPSAAEMARLWVDNDAAGSYAGQRGDDALFNAACVLYHGFDLREGALELLRHYNAVKCAPPWNEARLVYKLKQAAGTPQKHAPGGLYRWMLRKQGHTPAFVRSGGGAGPTVAAEPMEAKTGKLVFNLRSLAKEVRHIPGFVDADWFARLSPVPVDGCSAADFLAALYPPGSRVLIFTDFYSQGQFMFWNGRGAFRLARRKGVKAVRSELPRGGRDGVWFLNQPVSGEWLPNPRALDDHGRPKLSRRSEEVVTAWRYLVLESDHAPDNLWLRFLAKIPLPIAAIYTSGGKSIHALVRVDAESKAWWDRYKELIKGLFTIHGADPAAITAVRLTRLPGCMRGDKLQRLLYLNPNPADDGEPLVWKGAEV
jgi:hypothetical protein